MKKKKTNESYDPMMDLILLSTLLEVEDVENIDDVDCLRLAEELGVDEEFLDLLIEQREQQ